MLRRGGLGRGGLRRGGLRRRYGSRFSRRFGSRFSRRLGSRFCRRFSDGFGSQFRRRYGSRFGGGDLHRSRLRHDRFSGGLGGGFGGRRFRGGDRLDGSHLHGGFCDRGRSGGHICRCHRVCRRFGRRLRLPGQGGKRCRILPLERGFKPRRDGARRIDLIDPQGMDALTYLWQRRGPGAISRNPRRDQRRIVKVKLQCAVASTTTGQQHSALLVIGNRVDDDIIGDGVGGGLNEFDAGFVGHQHRRGRRLSHRFSGWFDRWFNSGSFGRCRFRHLGHHNRCRGQNHRLVAGQAGTIGHLHHQRQGARHRCRGNGEHGDELALRVGCGSCRLGLIDLQRYRTARRRLARDQGVAVGINPDHIETGGRGCRGRGFNRRYGGRFGDGNGNGNGNFSRFGYWFGNCRHRWLCHRRRLGNRGHNRRRGFGLWHHHLRRPPDSPTPDHHKRCGGTCRHLPQPEPQNLQFRHRPIPFAPRPVTKQSSPRPFQQPALERP